MGAHLIPDRDSLGHTLQTGSPFSAKEIDGKKLYKREHGVVVNCSPGANVFSIVCPYDQAKINEAKIVWQPSGCTADFKVYDTPTGTISTVPNYMLNQFGFTVGLSEGSHHSTCRYDADIIKDMKVECTITCPAGMAAQDICVNFILNELK
jgi:hypothetical protein